MNARQINIMVAGALAVFGLCACGDETTAAPDSPAISGLEGGSGSSGSGTSLTGKPNWVYLNPAIDYGEMTDERDGQVYKTVKIGDQVWMAENMNYAYTGVPFDYDGETSDSISWCFRDSSSNCVKYGRLYTWAAAMDSVGSWSTNGSGCGFENNCRATYPVRGICPKGWHLPTETEWNTLFQFRAADGMPTVNRKLRSQSGWTGDVNGTDAYGFSALPAGARFAADNFGKLDRGYTYFWSSTALSRYTAYRMHMDDAYDMGLEGRTNKYYGLSVRCLKD